MLGSKCSGEIVITFKQVPLCFNGLVPFMIFGNNSDRHTFPCIHSHHRDNEWDDDDDQGTTAILEETTL